MPFGEGADKCYAALRRANKSSAAWWGHTTAMPVCGGGRQEVCHLTSARQFGAGADQRYAVWQGAHNSYATRLMADKIHAALRVADKSHATLQMADKINAVCRWQTTAKLFGRGQTFAW
ncbi:hypothetical protein XELAEV_18044754mg [Xenopus laevis]|uniref:Uncharacterized protein n=1 Tax=Xenopus laevis TaxID=8355 RepID=A0A974BZB3_XENLA|nr:hypothetical protein XELAEV_18044754mg [Xenopus laevis]